MKTVARVSSGLALVTAACAAQASFHLMQIEQVQGGVNGDLSQQAVQLRMRSAFQDQLQFARLRVFDAAGANPVLLVDLATTVANDGLGVRVLIATPEWNAAQSPAPDYLMTAIPPAYLAGGRLVFESDGGIPVYSVCWGTYAGSNSGPLDNDDDGNYGPCVPGPLPATGLAALLFEGTASALGTSNAADYSPTAGAAIFTNNAGAGAAVAAPAVVARGGDCNDADASVFPGAAEVAGNRRDDDCDGLADESANGDPSGDTNDDDGDGASLQQGDCDDTYAATRAGFAEIAGDRRDNDCDGFAEESDAFVFSNDGSDHDGDGFGLFGRVFGAGFE